jgi:hypothetical protein
LSTPILNDQLPVRKQEIITQMEMEHKDLERFTESQHKPFQQQARLNALEIDIAHCQKIIKELQKTPDYTENWIPESIKDSIKGDMLPKGYIATEIEHAGTNNIDIQHLIEVEQYNTAQIDELTKSIQQGFDISHYKSPEFSATHMYLARLYQENNLPLDNITPNVSSVSIIERRNQLINEANDHKMESELSRNPSSLAKINQLTNNQNALIKPVSKELRREIGKVSRDN